MSLTRRCARTNNSKNIIATIGIIVLLNRGGKTKQYGRVRDLFFFSGLSGTTKSLSSASLLSFLLSHLVREVFSEILFGDLLSTD